MQPKKSWREPKAPSPLTPGAEKAVGVTVEELAAFYVLDSIKYFGPQKFKQVYEAGLKLPDVIANPSRLDLPGKRGKDFRAGLAQIRASVQSECRDRAVRQINAAAKLGARIITYSSPSYPRQVYRSNNPVGVLYVRGNVKVLNIPLAIACVGSRGIRPPYRRLHEAFVRTACKAGYAIVSGFALGADTIGHNAARANSGQTICCMPGGLDRPFPPENKQLWDDLLAYDGAVLVSEFPFGTRASSLTLRKRNKLIVAFAHGVLISQTSATGGAMNAYRFALEQRKPVATFEADDKADTSGNKLIAEKCSERDAVFTTNAVDEAAYNQWLQTLSSSI